MGGDIIENKKTFLYLKALELSNEEDKQKLLFFYKQKLQDNSIKIDEVKRIFERYDIPLLIQKMIKEYTTASFSSLDRMNISSEKQRKVTSFWFFFNGSKQIRYLRNLHLNFQKVATFANY